MLPNCKVTSLLATALLFVFILGTTATADELLSIKAGYQLLSPKGSIAGTVGGIGDKIDVQRDLDLDDSTGFTGEVSLNWGKSRLSFNYLPISFSGTGTFNVTKTFKGETFTAGDRVNSDLDIALYDIGYSYFLLNLDDLAARLQLGVELAVKVADAEVMLRNLSGPMFEERESALVPIPTIGMRGRIALADFLGLVGRVGYLEYDRNYFFDAEAQLEFSPLPMMGIYAGYRHFDLKIDESDLFVKTEFSGPFGGLLVRF